MGFHLSIARMMLIGLCGVCLAGQAGCKGERDHAEELDLRELREPKAGAEPRVKLTCKLPQGQYLMRSDLTVDLKVEAEGQKVAVKTSGYTDVRVGIEAPDSRGVVGLQATVSDMVLTARTGDRTLRLNTVTGDTDQKLAGMASLKGMTARCAMNRHGELVDRSGVDLFMRRAQSAGVPNPEMISSVFTHDIPATFGSRMLPDGPVGVGAIWRLNYPHAAIKGLDVPCEAELVAIEDSPEGKLAHIKLYAPLVIPENTEVPNAPGTYTGGAVEIVGQLVFNIDRGLVTRAEFSGIATMDIEVDGEQARSDVEFRTKTTIENRSTD